MRHLLSIEDLDRGGIERILDRAKSFTEVSERVNVRVAELDGADDVTITSRQEVHA